MALDRLPKGQPVIADDKPKIARNLVEFRVVVPDTIDTRHHVTVTGRADSQMNLIVRQVHATLGWIYRLGQHERLGSFLNPVIEIRLPPNKTLSPRGRAAFTQLPILHAVRVDDVETVE